MKRLRKLNIIIGDEDAIINVDNVVDKGGKIMKRNFYYLSVSSIDKVFSRVFLQRQLWIVNYYIKSLSNNLSNENIKTGVSREMIFQK